MIILSVRLSRHSIASSPGKTETWGFYHMVAKVSSILSQNFMPTGEGVPLERRHETGAPPSKTFFASISLSRVKTVADRHRHSAYHNKHWRRAS